MFSVHVWQSIITVISDMTKFVLTAVLVFGLGDVIVLGTCGGVFASCMVQCLSARGWAAAVWSILQAVVLFILLCNVLNILHFKSAVFNTSAKGPF